MDLPFLKNYEELKPRLSIRLNNPERIKPDTVSQPFLDFLVTCHIDVSDVVGETACCTVKANLMEHVGVGEDRLFSDAIRLFVGKTTAGTIREVPAAFLGGSAGQ